MRRPPSPVQLPAYPVTGGVSLMAIAVTVMTGAGRWPIERFEIGPTAFHGEPWRLLTTTLPHANALHLLFNVYWLWVFGTLLEEVLGHIRLLALMALFAAGSAAAEYAVFGVGIGLSGVGYGLFGMLWVLSRNDRRFADGVDARTAQTFVVWFFFCIVATYTKIFPVANVAHGAGALLGALVGAAMSARAPASRLLAGAGIPALLVASFAGATVLRTRVNLGHDGHASFQLGYQAIQEGRFDDAIRAYHDSLAMNDKDARAWHNLGVACAGAGRSDEALDAYRHSFEIDRHDGQRRHAYFSAAYHVAAEAQGKKDHEKAIALLREIVAVAPDEGRAWAMLVTSYQALGRTDEAEAARVQAEHAAPRVP